MTATGKRLFKHWEKVQPLISSRGSVSVEEVMVALGLADRGYVKGLMRAFAKLSEGLTFDGDRIHLGRWPKQVAAQDEKS